MLFRLPVAIAASLAASASAFPFVDVSSRDASKVSDDTNAYIAPGPNDSRSPCPGLNTLANHGYIPRNGRNVTQQNINDGFLNGFGMDSTTVSAAMSNAFSVCYYVTGSVCNALPNLTLLAEPHTLEHDGSFSREDYHMAYSGQKRFNNNQNFNSTIFNSGLAVLGNNKWMNYSLANQFRMQRVSLAYQQDLPGWFIASPVVQGVELGFIFGVMSDPTLPNFDTNPQVRVDWWKYWTTNESFPTPLGWKKPSPARNSTFVFSVSSAVEHASVTATPSKMPPATLTATNYALRTTTFSTVLPVPTDPPYVAPASAYLHKRAGDSQAAAAQVVDTDRLHRAYAAVPAGPSFPNPYVDVLSPQQWADVAAARQAQVRAVMAQYAAN